MPCDAERGAVTNVRPEKLEFITELERNCNVHGGAEGKGCWGGGLGLGGRKRQRDGHHCMRWAGHVAHMGKR